MGASLLPWLNLYINATKVDSFPMALVADELDSLAGASVFSTLDLKSGFYQIKVHQDSQQKTAFATHNGLYEFLTMPFGLANSGGLWVIF